ncbi:MAG: hypothetical protein EOO50_09255 [Flavobacterium sp.]|uniref:hypothetical protein n=1 Tax=Flavobacterium sp. TaxID=239 RepID=UPI0011F4C24E|nr:hypothetical protein [Flavobacterium sp.]RZJ66549.1 MAG: hypothetical protein EOO50_09255 [Flavobacterium sp.]
MKMIKMMSAVIVMAISMTGFAQTKKVAVVTFYADKQVGLSDVGLGAVSLATDLTNDPNFNLQPLIQQFHDKFFNEYAKKFPFELEAEATVIGKPEYQSFTPEYEKGFEATRYVTAPGYKAITPNYGKANTQAMTKLFAEYDGVMYVFLTFELTKGFGVGGTASTKMRAYTNIVLYNKKGEKVFTINENANSKKTGMMVGGMPVMKTDKILPMCESALTELMADLDKRIQKIIDKSAKKL